MFRKKNLKIYLKISKVKIRENVRKQKIYINNKSQKERKDRVQRTRIYISYRETKCGYIYINCQEL